jgi:hypothetical protein
MTAPTPRPVSSGTQQQVILLLVGLVATIMLVTIIGVFIWGTSHQAEQRKAADPTIGQTWTVKSSHLYQGRTTLPCEVEIWTRSGARDAWIRELQDPQAKRDGVPDRLKAQARARGDLIVPNAGTRLRITDHTSPSSATYTVEVADGMYRGRTGLLQDFGDGCVGP